MTLHQNHIGCDIAKAMLDLYDPRRRKLWRVANEAGELAAFAATLDPGRDFLVFEATGHHDRLLRQALARRSVAFARLNPKQVRRFAEARGRLAKTDRLDARTLSEFGTLLKPPADRPASAERERLVALARRRDQLVEMRARELKHRSEAFEAAVIADIEANLAFLDDRVTLIEGEIERCIAASPEIAAEAARLVSAPGVGRITALTLIAHMPELGTLSPKSAASLAGLAPVNNDSGRRQGRRSIRGGRPRVRKALYMAALGAIRASPRFRSFYTALAGRSGSKKLALVAVARKLLTALNAMLRDNKQYA